VGHSRQPVIIDTKITEEYVICGVCLTRNRVVSHKKTLRPVCGRCGYPLPDPFEAQSTNRSFGRRIAQDSRALAAIAGLLLAGLFVWLATGKEERWSLSSDPRTQPPGTTLMHHRGETVDAVALIVRRESTKDNDEREDLPPRSLPLRDESQLDGRYGLGTPNTEALMRSESVVIVIDVCAGRAHGYWQAGGSRDGELPSVSVLSELQPMKGDPLSPLVGPHVVEQIYIDTAPGPRG